MKIVIPTLGRPDRLLTYELAKNIVGEDNVYVFFHNHEDKDAYLINYEIKNWVVTNKPKGISGQRNAILDFFSVGEKIIMMNDDITGFYKLAIKNLEPMTIEQTKQEFNNCFDICEKNEIKLWGIYPIKNNFFMKYKINNKGFIIGSFMGIIVNELRFDETLHSKEDYDYTLQNIIKYKKIARFDYLTSDARHQEKKGGCSYLFTTEEGKKLYSDDCKKLANKYPQFIRLNTKRDNELLITL